MKHGFATIFFFTSTVFAAAPPSETFAGKQPLSDDELSELRGKYTTKQQDFYFGLQLQTHYIDNHHQVTQQVQMQIELSADSDMRVSVADNLYSTTNKPITTTHGQEKGLQQRIQIAGDNNQVKNHFDVKQGRLSPMENSTSIESNRDLSNDDGSVIYTRQDGQIGYQASIDGATFSQGIMTQKNSKILLQSTAVKGSNHRIVNQALIRYQGITTQNKEQRILKSQLRALMRNGL